MSETATFVCYFPAVDYAIRITGNGDGMRIVLDIPETEMPKALPLLKWRNVALQVTVLPVKGQVSFGTA